MTKYTNQQLAEEYFSIARQIKPGHDALKTVEGKIAEAQVDIANVFEKVGTLDVLKIPGVVKETRQILESILKDGYAVARERAYWQSVEKLRRRESEQGQTEAWEEKYKWEEDDSYLNDNQIDDITRALEEQR